MAKYLSREHRNKLRLLRLGKKHTEEVRHKISESMKGRNRTEETKNKISKSVIGNKNPNWKGGISKLPYSLDWNETLRRSIRERDKYTCQICGILQGDKIFHIHHIDYNKENCNPDNLITLCKSCHSKTNGHREYWISKFKFL